MKVSLKKYCLVSNSIFFSCAQTKKAVFWEGNDIVLLFTSQELRKPGKSLVRCKMTRPTVHTHNTLQSFTDDNCQYWVTLKSSPITARAARFKAALLRRPSIEYDGGRQAMLLIIPFIILSSLPLQYVFGKKHCCFCLHPAKYMFNVNAPYVHYDSLWQRKCVT